MRRILRALRRLLRSNRTWIRNTRFFALALFNQRILVLRPSRRDWGTPSRVGLAFDELRLRAGRDSIRAWWVPHDDAKVTVLLFPGRAANVSQELEAIRYVSSLGANVFAFDYPGFGTSEGTATVQGCEEAARAAWDALLAKGIAPDAIILYGRSLGAAIAARLATQVDCRALVFHGCASSMTDLRDHHLPKWVTKIRRLTIPLDSTKPVADARCPVIVVHAREDWLVPIQLARRVFDAAREPKRMIEVAGNHFDGNWLYDRALRNEWQRLIGTSVTTGFSPSQYPHRDGLKPVATSAALEPMTPPPNSLTLTAHEARRRIARALRPKPLSGVSAVVFTGEPVTDGLIARWRNFFPSDAPLFTTYLDACAYRIADPPLPGTQPIGRPLTGVDVRVVAANGEDCAMGEIGALVIRGEKTGDLARVRDDGNIELCGRTDRRAWIGGELVDLEAIERERGQAVVVETGIDGEPRVRVAKPAPERSFVTPRDPVELQLARIWETLLEREGIGVTDDFFALGADSIMAVDLLARVQSEFGVALEPSALLPDATIEHLARLLRHHARTRDASPLVTIQRGNGRPLVCIHPSGGSILCYVELARLLGSDRAVVGLKGPDPRSSDAPLQHAPEMAARYIDALRAAHPHGPYLLAGYSFGGLIAYEMAQQLGDEASHVALLDTRFPRAYGPEDRNPVVDLGEVLERHDLDSPQVEEAHEHALWRELIELTGRYIPQEKRRLSSVQEFCRLYRLMPAADDVGYHDLRRFLRNLRANFRTMRHYVPAPANTRVTLFAATRTVEDRESDHLRNASLWSGVAPGLDVHRIEATHFNLLTPPSVQTLAASLRELLA
ncbi:MAG TPA: alpha/beta fold hydrolase [Thermoanaerobaculia bacterium]|nr:alpha/beta fold hydrolase [Thermoanaerobaculia bacterium]